jgi:hypothetical protein
MADQFETLSSGLESPATRAAAVTPSDSTDLATVARALYIGGAGNVVLDTAGGDTSVTFTGLAAGTILPVRVARVRSTSTTATSIVALW